MLDFQQITISLRTQNISEAIPQALRFAAHFKTFLHDLKLGRVTKISRSELLLSARNASPENAPLLQHQTVISSAIREIQAPATKVTACGASMKVETGLEARIARDSLSRVFSSISRFSA